MKCFIIVRLPALSTVSKLSFTKKKVRHRTHDRTNDRLDDVNAAIRHRLPTVSGFANADDRRQFHRNLDASDGAATSCVKRPILGRPINCNLCPTVAAVAPPIAQRRPFSVPADDVTDETRRLSTSPAVIIVAVKLMSRLSLHSSPREAMSVENSPSANVNFPS
jgi:hypothetical protein